MTAPLSLREGRLVGDRYSLEALIGRGGMGEVWRARHVALKTPVAIKFLRGAPSPSERAKQRFLTEAQVTANLRTRHAVQVFDFGVLDEGLPYLVMELLVGETLDRRIARKGRLSVESTSLILQKAARALERAHALGIVHRDFKPENVMLVADEEEGGEQVKVVDFGIAKLVGDLDATVKAAMCSLVQTRAPTGAAVLDRTTGGVGTPQYMAPEQVEDSALVGPAADIWAFGVVAYECLTGRRPFEDESMGRLLLQVLAAAPTAPSAIAAVPKLFDDWFRVACAREPGDRFPDIATAAGALAVALDRSALDLSRDGRPLPEPPAPPRHEAAPTLSSRKDVASVTELGGFIEPPVVSPLAVTLASLPATSPRRSAEAPAPQEDPPPLSSLPPRRKRTVSATVVLGVALLAVMVAAQSNPDGQHERAARSGPDTPDLATLPLSLDEPSAIRLPMPLDPVATSGPVESPPPAPSSVPPPRPPVRARPSDAEATPSAYRLPPLGL
jgi:eukaryotic-like serine/threonine-protein kinase